MWQQAYRYFAGEMCFLWVYLEVYCSCISLLWTCFCDSENAVLDKDVSFDSFDTIWCSSFVNTFLLLIPPSPVPGEKK